jgi:GNAT superfamily N-acetyltransferase
MMYRLELDEQNRPRLAEAFQHSPRVDYAIDCAVEGQIRQVFVDDPRHPAAFCIRTGPLWYFAGHADTPGGQALLREFPPYNLLMPSPLNWIAAAQDHFQGKLIPMPRYSFSTENLTEEHIKALIDTSPHREKITPLDVDLVERLAEPSQDHLGFEDFGSTAEFLRRGMGYAALEGDEILGIGYSSLVCSRGIEVSLFVEERYRQRGLGTALASRLLLETLGKGLRPNWDAANPESCKLALKLGYKFKASYETYYYTQD